MRLHRFGHLALALSAAAGTILFSSNAAGAADVCQELAVPNVRLIDWDGYNPKVEYSAPIPVALAAGTYNVSGSSFDTYLGRATVTQASEIWDVQFLDASGAVIATSGTTGDLPDRVETAEWSGSLGSVTLPTGAVSVRAHHRPDAVADGSANSVVPKAITICTPALVTTTTTSTTTTVAPTTSTTTTTTTVPATTTTTVPTSVGSATTVPTPSTAPVKVGAETTVKVEVKPQTEESLAVTGSGSRPVVAAGLIMFGLGVLMLGYKAQGITHRR